MKTKKLTPLSDHGIETLLRLAKSRGFTITRNPDLELGAVIVDYFTVLALQIETLFPDLESYFEIGQGYVAWMSSYPPMMNERKIVRELARTLLTQYDKEHYYAWHSLGDYISVRAPWPQAYCKDMYGFEIHWTRKGEAHAVNSVTAYYAHVTNHKLEQLPYAQTILHFGA